MRRRVQLFTPKLIRPVVFFLLVSILASISSCSSVNRIKLHTNATIIPYAHAQMLDITSAFSTESSSSWISDAKLVGDHIAVLVRNESSYMFAIFSENGENIGRSQAYPISESEGIYGIFSNEENELLLVTGENSISADQQSFIYNDLSVTAFDSSGEILGMRCQITKCFQTAEPTVEIDAHGNLYVKTGNTISCYGTDGKLNFKKTYGELSGIYVIGNTPIAASVSAKLIPITKNGSDEAITGNLQGGSSLVYAGCRDGMFAYNSSGIFAYNFEVEQMDPVLLWNNTDLEKKNESKIVRILSRNIFLVENTNKKGDSELYLLLPTNEKPSEKQVVTLAVLGLGSTPYITTLIDSFNSQSDVYELQVRDYLADGEMNPDDAKNRINLDILTQDAGDIYMYSENDFLNQDAGLFADLNPLIEGDPSFSKDDYSWNVIGSCETNGELYRICTNYVLDFYSIPRKFIGDKTSWTIDEYNAIEETLPSGLALLPKENAPEKFLNSLIGTTYRNWIDSASGKLNFETEDFYKVMQFAATPGSLETDEPCLQRHIISRFRDYVRMTQGFTEPVTFIGYPTDDNGKINATIINYFSIAANTDVRDGAWAVVKFLLSDEMQKVIFENPECGIDGIPVNKNVLNWNISQVKADIEQEEGEGVVTQELVDSFTTLLDSIDSCDRYDLEIGNIVQEESAPYYLGQKSVEEVATLMENRINLILEERKG